ncbi:hypothetical protein HPB52_004424 [Rhipicephalus sanguineus]|uniref:Peptidase S1 domain-containing protein n=1 Tax=Rhipicephalus sanguineus TaxID=34632 RepID=A0A9D4SQ69_RHISA|nr:hypothetical protein HPB52_004424 [Rhipicephalus sanguineus]
MRESGILKGSWITRDASCCWRNPEIARSQGVEEQSNQRFRAWCKTSDETTEFLWKTIFPHLPKKRKRQPGRNEDVLVLGDQEVPEIHLNTLRKGPKFAFQFSPSPVDRVVFAKAVSNKVPEDLGARASEECVEVVASQREVYKKRSCTGGGLACVPKGGNGRYVCPGLATFKEDVSMGPSISGMFLRISSHIPWIKDVLSKQD